MPQSQLIPRRELTENELEDALAECAREPIHIPGSIQPHGVMIVCDSSNYTIQQVSENLQSFFGVEAQTAIGKPLSDLLGNAVVKNLKQLVIEKEMNYSHSSLQTIDGTLYDVVAHISGDSLVYECEPLPDKKYLQTDFYYDEIRNFALHMQNTNSLDDLYSEVTNTIRAVTGFDRVKLYRFDEDWNGAVVAESKADFMPSYKGLHFPATDIPEQARKLYTQNYIRHIADISYSPVPLVPQNNPATQAPLDMSMSSLRSVSPVHIQYLDNMQVKASLSISILQNRKLWGLIACHHNSPHPLPHRLRMISEIMGHIFSAQLSTLEEMVGLEKREKRNLLIEKMNIALEYNHQIESLMQGRQQLAVEAMGADGMVINLGNYTFDSGSIPNKPAIKALLSWLRSNSPNAIYHTNDVAKLFKDIPELCHLRGGMLAAPISSRKNDCLIWFRNEIIEHVSWAGNPEKPIEKVKAGYRLTPRSSFELWKETVEHKSRNWRKEDVETAQSLARIILESEKLSAEESTQVKEEFLANMSHELRTPMNAIIGIVNILDMDKTLSDKQRDFVHTLKLSASSMLTLVNDLLDIAKVESKQMKLESKPFNMAETLEEVRSLMAVRASEQQIQLNINAPHKNELYFEGDPSRLRQVLLNLVGNAVKFTESGFVNITSRVRERKDGVATLRIEVVDSGIGMSEKQLKHIFEKFVQADDSISRRYGGTGLGLAITKHLVELMDGSIDVVSKENMGTKFTITLPLKEQPVSLAQPPSSDADKVISIESDRDKASKHGNDMLNSKKRILLAEDYEGNIIVALTLLQSMGYEVIVVKNGKDAIHKLEAEKFDLVLMDVQMPIMDGLMATKIIVEKQSKGEISPVPIVGMTAHALAGDQQRCLNAGMRGYISKPFDPDHLEDLILTHIKAS
ncbi:MAG: ATP-binding protein [Alphaproteobacteria bacterium]|nr:ATP-binding protein [Alphaproteobacteria bacterium]